MNFTVIYVTPLKHAAIPCSRPLIHALQTFDNCFFHVFCSFTIVWHPFPWIHSLRKHHLTPTNQPNTRSRTRRRHLKVEFALNRSDSTKDTISGCWMVCIWSSSLSSLCRLPEQLYVCQYTWWCWGSGNSHHFVDFEQCSIELVPGTRSTSISLSNQNPSFLQNQHWQSNPNSSLIAVRSVP